MFLTVLAMSLLGVVVSAVLFAAATQHADQTPRVDRPTMALTPSAQGFFVGDGAPQPRVPIEALLLQIERHVQLEQAAAESFLHEPTAESLHTRSMSPLVH
jgi:hypothetical protein